MHRIRPIPEPGPQTTATATPIRLFSTPLRRLLLVVGIVALALLVGTQIAQPDKRVLQVVAGGLIVYLAFRTQSIFALMLAVLFLPFPKSTSYGNTNVAFILLVFVVWLFRVTTHRINPTGRTGIDVPVIGLVMAYALSFYNVEGVSDLAKAWSIYLAFFTYLFLTYMVINIVQSTSDVRRVLNIQAISCFIVCLLSLYELNHPGAAIVPGWIDFGMTTIAEEREHGLRIGSTFLDYELFGEYCAINLFLQFFLFTRATSRSRRYLILGLSGLTAFCLFATVTRGAVISFLVGLLYLAWLSRRRLDFVKVVLFGSLAITLFFGGDYLVSHFTRSSSVVERLAGTKVEKGFIPDTRVGAWEQVTGNILKHPFIGHGPYYSSGKGMDIRYWPHNVYLFYAHTVGIIGLAFYLWVLWELWKATRPGVASLGSGSYIDGARMAARLMLFTFMIDQIKIDYLRNPRYSFFIWFLFGLFIAIGNVARREAQNAPIAEPVPSRVLPERRSVRLPRISSQPAVSPK